MAPRRIRVSQHVVLPAVVALVAAVGVPLLIAAPGQAAPRLTIAQVESQISTLNDQAEAANEKRNELNGELAATSARSAQVRARIAAQSATLAKLRTELGVFASAAYRSGGIDTTLQLMLSDNPTNFLDGTSSLDVVARGQQSAMRRVAAAQQQLDQSRVELAQTVAQQRAVAAQAAAQSQAINAKVAQARHLLDSLQASQRRALLAQQAAAAAASARASRAALSRVHFAATTSSRSAGTSFHGGGYTGPASGRAAAAVAYARAQVGKAYVWGGSGPNSFDCSGLTMAAWAHAGVSLPHYTVAQYDATQHVSLSDIQPGDLIFFHADMHHVGIYIGGGMFVQAENSANGVVVTPVAGWWSSDISGVGRP